MISNKGAVANKIKASFYPFVIGIALFYWLLESFFDSFVFHQGSLVDRIFAPDPNEIWMRLLVTLILSVSWSYYKVIIDRYKKAQESLKKSEEYMRSLLQTSASVIICLSSDHRIIEFNHEAERIYGQKREDVLGKDYFDLFLPESVWDQVASDIRKVLGGEPTRGYENPIRATDGSERILDWSVSRIPIGEGQFGIMAVGQDVTELRKAKEELERRVLDRTSELAFANEELKIQIAVCNRAEDRLIMQHVISRILADSTSLAVATPRIVRAVCENLGWDMGAIWMVDRQANELSCVEHWHLPSIDFSEFEAITRVYRFPYGEGMPGRIWASGKPEWIRDVAGDPSFLRAVYAERAGIHSAFGFPIKLGADILGVIEFLSREVRCPDKDIVDMFDSIGSQIGQFAERKHAEEKVRTSLNEKDALLHEVYHRVKNNMQIISSLLSLQSRYIRDKEAGEVFFDCRNRIRSMALVHEMLYQSDNLAKINSKDYIKKLLDGILNSYSDYAGNINVEVSSDEVSLRPESAIPLGFIINELVVNSLKHAFPQDRIDKEKRGEMRIEFLSIGQDMAVLIVKDNGVGVPDALDIDNSESVGLKLVNLLTRQMEGKIKILKKEGTEFRIEFKDKDL